MSDIPRRIRAALAAAGMKVLSVRTTKHHHLTIQARDGATCEITLASSPANIDDEARFAVQRARRALRRKSHD